MSGSQIFPLISQVLPPPHQSIAGTPMIPQPSTRNETLLSHNQSSHQHNHVVTSQEPSDHHVHVKRFQTDPPHAIDRGLWVNFSKTRGLPFVLFVESSKVFRSWTNKTRQFSFRPCRLTSNRSRHASSNVSHPAGKQPIHFSTISASRTQIGFQNCRITESSSLGEWILRTWSLAQ